MHLASGHVIDAQEADEAIVAAPLSALVFFLWHVVNAPLAFMEGLTPAPRPRRLPVVLSVDEASGPTPSFCTKRAAGMTLKRRAIT